MIKIVNVAIKGKYVLAPIADVTDVAYRVLCKKYGASLVFSEMVSVNALVRNNKATLNLIKTADEERPVAIQLFGSKLEYFSNAVKMLNSDIIDLNLGCPATNILKQGAGGALLIRPGKIKEIIETMVNNTDKPVTVKMRSGMKKVNAVEIAKIAEEAGASAITLHPRTIVQGYSGKEDWSLIKKVKETVSIPVIGNGDVVNGEKAKELLDYSKCDYVMIARAAMNNPMIFKQINCCLDNKKEIEIMKEDKIKLFLDYVELCERYDFVNFSNLKLTALNFCKGFEGSKELRVRLMKVKTKETLIEAVKNF